VTVKEKLRIKYRNFTWPLGLGLFYKCHLQALQAERNAVIVFPQVGLAVYSHFFIFFAASHLMSHARLATKNAISRGGEIRMQG